MPIIHIKGNSYLVGSQKMQLDLKMGNVLVKSGGGSSEFEKIIP